MELEVFNHDSSIRQSPLSFFIARYESRVSLETFIDYHGRIWPHMNSFGYKNDFLAVTAYFG